MAALTHFATGFAAKKIAPKVSVGYLLLASGALDLLCIPFALLNLNEVYWTHSLFMALVFTIIIGLITLLISKNKKTALIIGLLVFGHWVIDAITWPLVPELAGGITKIPLFFEGSPEIGLGLYSNLYVGTVLEISLLIIGISIYVKTRRLLKRKE